MSNFPFGAEKKAITVVIPAGETETGVIDPNGGSLVGIEMPGEWTAADLKVQTKGSDEVWRPLHDEMGEVIFDVSTGIYYAVAPDKVYGHRAIKLVSTAAQAARREFIVHIAYL